MCEAHINEAIRNAFRVKKVTSSHTKKQTEILAEQDIPEQELKKIVAILSQNFHRKFTASTSSSCSLNKGQMQLLVSIIENQ